MIEISAADLYDEMDPNERTDAVSWRPAHDPNWAKREAAQIRRCFPAAEVSILADWIIHVRLALAPYGRRYQVEMLAHRSRLLPNGCLVRQRLGPAVTLPDFALESRIPHIYPHSRPPWFKLCLFYPRLIGKQRIWKEGDPLIEILYLAVQWLAGYETWQITGEWPFPEQPHGAGPARPVDPPRYEAAEVSAASMLPAQDGLSAASTRRLAQLPDLHKLAQAAANDQGTEASRALLATASGQPSQLWPGWYSQAWALAIGRLSPQRHTERVA
jgi:hypothetical protein